MGAKVATLCDIPILGGQIWVLDALSMSEIVRIVLDIERLGESVVGLSESGQFLP